MKKQFIFVSLVLSMVGCINNDRQSPEAIATQYNEATYDYNWEKTSALLHPESLHQFREMLIIINRKLDSLDLKNGKLTKIDSLLNVVRNSEIQNLSDTAFFKKFMNTAMPTDLMRLSATKVTPIIKSLGHISEGEDTVHVVSRIYIKRNGVPIDGIKIISLKKFESEWRVLLPDELANSMKLRLQTQRMF